MDDFVFAAMLDGFDDSPVIYLSVEGKPGESGTCSVTGTGGPTA